jgi:hypothetical protein
MLREFFAAVFLRSPADTALDAFEVRLENVEQKIDTLLGK